MTQETVEDLERVKREMEELVRKKDGEINGLNGRLEDDASMIAKLQKTIKELQVCVLTRVTDLLLVLCTLYYAIAYTHTCITNPLISTHTECMHCFHMKQRCYGSVCN